MLARGTRAVPKYCIGGCLVLIILVLTNFQVIQHLHFLAH